MHRPSRHRQGYVMLLTLMIVAVLAIIGTSTLRISAVDHELAIQGARHMVMLNAADAGLGHARNELSLRDPDNWTHGSRDQNTDGAAYFINAGTAEAVYGGSHYVHNQGVYEVTATYERCGPPPSGYSTEAGSQHFRSDYWLVESVSSMQDVDMNRTSPHAATIISIIRKVKEGECVAGG